VEKRGKFLMKIGSKADMDKSDVESIGRKRRLIHSFFFF
jgi:hypothetical protein